MGQKAVSAEISDKSALTAKADKGVRGGTRSKTVEHSVWHPHMPN
jgi:hypothetical protein